MGKLINRKKSEVICANCGITFDKAISEINRTESNGGKHYCSLSCCSKKNIEKNLGKLFGHNNNPNLPKNTRDEYTGFREYIRRAKNRSKLGDLTLVDLKDQWEKQKGICPYTGIELKLPKARKKCEMYELASLDRIDSNKMYEKGNIVFVSAPINYMKNSMSEEETVAFCKKIALFWNNN